MRLLLAALLAVLAPIQSLAAGGQFKGTPKGASSPAAVRVPVASQLQFNNWLVDLNSTLKLPTQDLAAISLQASRAIETAAKAAPGAALEARFDAATGAIVVGPSVIALSDLSALRALLAKESDGGKSWLDAVSSARGVDALAQSMDALFDGAGKHGEDTVGFDPITLTVQALSANLPAGMRTGYDEGARERQRRALLAWHQSPRKTYVFVNSYSFKDDGTPGLNYYDMRPLAQILWAADPGVNVVFVTAMPVDESMVRHVLRGHPDAEAIRKRVHFVSLNDAGSDFLSQKLLDEKHAGALQQIRDRVAEAGAPAVLYPYMGGPYEWEMAARLGIPDSVYASHPTMFYWGSKSGGRKVFKAAMKRYRGSKKVRVKLADGAEDLYNLDAAAIALEGLLERHPNSQKVAVKLNLGSSGEGNIFPEVKGWGRLGHEERRAALRKILEGAKFGLPDAAGKLDDFAGAMASEGAVLEQFIPGIARATFPSVQMEILPDGTVRVLSSHEQILIDRNNYIGANLSADKAYRKVIERAALEAGKELAKRGVVGRFGTDFAVVKQDDGTYDAYYIENNIRLTGTTHPLVAASGLTGATYLNGKLRHPTERGAARYKSMDHDVRPNLVGMSVDAFLGFFDREENKQVLFDPERRSGVLFHLLPAVKAAGNVGYTIIAGSVKAVQAIQERLTQSLNRLELEYLTGARAEGLSYRFTGHDARERVEETLGHAATVKVFRTFLAANPEHLLLAGKRSGIAFHPHGYTVVGGSAKEIARLESEAQRLMERFVSEALKSALGL